MAINIESLSKNVSDNVNIFPYRDIEKKDWPLYFDADDKWVPYDEGWRNVGYVLPYPNVQRLKKLADLTRALSVSKKKMSIESGDPTSLSNYFCYQAIKGLLDYDPYTEKVKKVDFDLSTKEWLYSQFLLSTFLLETLRSEYEKIGGKYAQEEGDEEENFTPSSEDTSSESPKGTPSK